MKNSYRTLKRTIILRTMEVTILTIFVGAFILVFFVDGILQDGFIDAFVRALGFLHVSEPTAIRIYQLIFQQNKLLIVVIGFFILFIIRGNGVLLNFFGQGHRIMPVAF